MTSQPSGISRRTIAKGAAWSVPAIAVAAGAPAFAVSDNIVTAASIGHLFFGDPMVNGTRDSELYIVFTTKNGQPITFPKGTTITFSTSDDIFTWVGPKGESKSKTYDLGGNESDSLLKLKVGKGGNLSYVATQGRDATDITWTLSVPAEGTQEAYTRTGSISFYAPATDVKPEGSDPTWGKPVKIDSMSENGKPICGAPVVQFGVTSLSIHPDSRCVVATNGVKSCVDKSTGGQVAKTASTC